MESVCQLCNVSIPFFISHMQGYFRKARALYSLGQYLQAEEEFLKALKCEPGNEELERWLIKARDAKCE